MKGIKQFQTILSRNYQLIIITLCIMGIGVLLSFSPNRFIKPLHLLELDLQDLRTEWRTDFYNFLHPINAMDSALSESSISLILIHKREFDKYGFPPNREAIANIVNALSEHRAKVIAFDMTFELKRNTEYTKRLALASKEAENVIYPVTLKDSQNISLKEDFSLPTVLEDYLHFRSKGNSPRNKMFPERLPEETLLSSASALGHIRAPFDMDGKIRRVPLVVKGDDGLFYPSLSLMAICLFKEVPKEGIIIEWGKRIILDNKKQGKAHWRCEIPIDRKGQIRIDYNRKLKSFPNRYAFADVHRAWRSIPGLDKPQIRLEDFKGKLALIGYLEERSEQTPTPLELEFPGIGIHATILENILQKNFVREAPWWLDVIVLLFFISLMVILQIYPYRFYSLRHRLVYILIAIAGGTLLGFAIINFLVFSTAGMFINLTVPLATMSLACFATIGYRYVTTTEEFIDNLKQKTEELEQQKAYNEMILEHMGNGLIVMDNQGKITILNQKATQFFNLKNQVLEKPSKEVFGRNFPEMAESLTKALDLETGKKDRFSLDIDDYKLEVSLSYVDGMLDNRYSIIAVITDVTEVRELELQTQQQKLQNQFLRKSLQERKQKSETFAGYLSHKFRTPIATLDSWVDQLEKKNDSKSPYIRYIQGIRKAVEKLKNEQKNIKDGLLRLARLQEIELETGDLNQVVEESLETIKTPEKERIQIEKSFADLPPIQLNNYWLKEAIDNLIINAIQAMSGGGTLSIKTKSIENEVILSINDTGYGIPEKNLQDIFIPWFTTKKDGFGIGLAMVKDIVNLHMGKIQCDSQEGKGTKFTLKFPQGGTNDTKTKNFIC